MSMKLIQTISLDSGSSSSINFTGIPQTGTDLVVTVNGYDTSGNIGVYVRFNSDSATNYKWLRLRGSGSAASTGINGAATQIVVAGSGISSNIFGTVSIRVFDYTSSNVKSVSAEGSVEDTVTGAWQEFVAGLWSGTSPINSITLTSQGGTWAQYTTASLYAITKGSGGATVA